MINLERITFLILFGVTFMIACSTSHDVEYQKQQIGKYTIEYRTNDQMNFIDSMKISGNKNFIMCWDNGITQKVFLNEGDRLEALLHEWGPRGEMNFLKESTGEHIGPLYSKKDSLNYFFFKNRNTTIALVKDSAVLSVRNTLLGMYPISFQGIFGKVRTLNEQEYKFKLNQQNDSMAFGVGYDFANDYVLVGNVFYKQNQSWGNRVEKLYRLEIDSTGKRTMKRIQAF